LGSGWGRAAAREAYAAAMTNADPGFDERYWRAFKARARRRTNHQMALILCPLLIVLAIYGFLSPKIYQAGDFRDTIEFRLVFFGLFIALNVAGMIVSIRWLWKDRRGSDSS
jgi:hypothetical protein